MSDVTRILSQIEQGDPQAAEKLLPLVYNELRKLAALKLAQEKPGQTLQATALVHEAYARLARARDRLRRPASTSPGQVRRPCTAPAARSCHTDD
jgi:DNA-directed RNA polymerase specialized sigma24 family protein